MKIKKESLLGVINLVCIAALLLWLKQSISFKEVIADIQSLPKVNLLTVLTLGIVTLAIYGARMSKLLGVGFYPASATIVLGFGLNGILPFRLGDVAKMMYVKQLFGISTARVAAATAVEKLLDIVSILAIGFGALHFVSFGRIYSGIYGLAVLLLIAIGGLLAARFLLARFDAGKQKIHLWLNFVISDVWSHIKGRHRALLSVYTIAIWAVTILSTYVMFASLYSKFDWSDALLLTLVLVLAIAIPGAPAGLGIVEAGIVGYLHEVLGIDTTHAIAAALAFHLATIVPQVLGAVGILFWATFRKGLTLRK